MIEQARLKLVQEQELKEVVFVCKLYFGIKLVKGIPFGCGLLQPESKIVVDYRL